MKPLILICTLLNIVNAFTTTTTSVPTFTADMTFGMAGAYGGVDTDNVLENAEVIEVDMFDATISEIQEMHDRNQKVVCYISVGTIEDWRPDVQADEDAWYAVAGKRLATVVTNIGNEQYITSCNDFPFMEDEIENFLYKYPVK